MQGHALPRTPASRQTDVIKGGAALIQSYNRRQAVNASSRIASNHWFSSRYSTNNAWNYNNNGNSNNNNFYNSFTVRRFLN